MIEKLEPENWTERCIAEMRRSVSLLGETAPLLAEMAEYHLGWFDDRPGSNQNRGKMIRPLIAIHSARAVGGNSSGMAAVPLAAALELLHNFTLIHDDIQDHSPSRRHRPTVWSKWGVAQAINAGDALFAAAHIALLGSMETGVDADVVVELMRGFDATTIGIVSGQVLDLQFETRADVTADEYIEMISGKTARIVEFAAGGGAWVAGAVSEQAAHLAAFGLALGLGFQVQDDLLGTFGEESATGKATADDIRRKKQSLPVLLLRESASADDLAILAEIYARSEVDANAVERVLGLMRRYEIEEAVRSRVAEYHDQAEDALVITGLAEARLSPLFELTRRLGMRTN